MFRTITCLIPALLLISGQVFAQGSILGTISDNQGPVAAGEAGVRIYDSNGAFVEEAPTQSGGTYASSSLPSGLYFLHSVNSIGLIDQVYDGIVCVDSFQSCEAQVTSGASVSISTGNVIGVDLVLDPGFRVSGRVTDAGTTLPVADVDVCLYFGSGGFATPIGICGATDANGDYTTSGGTTPGSNYLAVVDPEDPDLGFYVPEVFDDVPITEDISFFDFSAGTLLDLTTGDQTGVGFQLDLGGRVRVSVTGADSGNPIEDFNVVVFDPDGGDDRYFFPDPGNGGNFVTPALPAGDVAVSVATFDDIHVGQFLMGGPCAPGLCFSPFAFGFEPPTVTVSPGATNSFDVALELGFSISGTVRDDGGQPVSFPQVCAHFADGRPAGACSMSMVAKGSGVYTTELLPARVDYRVIATATTRSDVTAKIFPDVTVPPLAGAFGITELTGLFDYSAEFRAGQPVSVGPAAGGNATGIDFTLDPAGSIQVQATDQAMSLTIDLLDVVVFDDRGRLANVSEDGSNPSVVGGLPEGSYRMLVAGDAFSGDRFLAELYEDIDCTLITCLDSLEAGALITVTPGTTNIVAVTLTLGGRLTGIVSDSFGNPVEFAPVRIYDDAGGFLGQVETDEFGFYEADLPAGDYQVATGAAPLGFLDKIFGGPPVPCPLNDCDQAAASLSGSPVNVTLAETSGINFMLDLGGTISGMVSDFQTELPIANLPIKIFDESGNLAPIVASGTGGRWQSLPLPDGNYFLYASGESRGFLNEIFDGSTGIPCLPDLCQTNVVSQGLAVPVTAPSDSGDISFALSSGNIITRNDLDNQSRLGAAIAACGQRIAIGVPGDDEAGVDAGAVLIYGKRGSGYAFEQKLLPSPQPADGERFGSSVSCSGDMVVVGAPAEDLLAKRYGLPATKGPGPDKSAYVIQMTGPGTSAQLGKLIGTNLGMSNASGFGSAVAINNMTVAIGAPTALVGGTDSGAAMLFDFADVDPQASAITVSDPTANSGAGFGTSLSVSKGKVAIGAPGQVNTDAVASGVAQIYANLAGGNNWDMVGKFSNAGAQSGDGFGTGLSLQGNMLAIGAPGTSGGQGAAHVVTLSGTEPDNFQAVPVGGPIAPGDPTANSQFGASVSLAGNSIAIGSPGADNGSGQKTGAGYLFGLSGGVWGQLQKNLATTGNDGDLFGVAIAYDGDNFVIGAPNGAPNVTVTGFVQAFTDPNLLFRGGFE